MWFFPIQMIELRKNPSYLDPVAWVLVNSKCIQVDKQEYPLVPIYVDYNKAIIILLRGVYTLVHGSHGKELSFKSAKYYVNINLDYRKLYQSRLNRNFHYFLIDCLIN